MKEFAIIISNDLAGENIKDKLQTLYDFKEIDNTFDNKPILQSESHPNIKVYTSTKKCIDNENIDDNIEADLLIFATTHTSASGIPSLSVHPIGNWGEAILGGKPNTLYPSSATYLRTFYLLLKKHNTLDFDIIHEATHHGPDVKTPTIFMEIGSSEKEWSIPEAGKVIAKALWEGLTTKQETPEIVAIGIGGQHTTPNFNKLVERNNIGFSHFCAKYNLENLTKEKLEQAINKTLEKVNLIVVDWKGLGQHKEHVKEILEEINIEYKKVKDLK